MSNNFSGQINVPDSLIAMASQSAADRLDHFQRTGSRLMADSITAKDEILAGIEYSHLSGDVISQVFETAKAMWACWQNDPRVNK